MVNSLARFSETLSVLTAARDSETSTRKAKQWGPALFFEKAWRGHSLPRVIECFAAGRRFQFDVQKNPAPWPCSGCVNPAAILKLRSRMKVEIEKIIQSDESTQTYVAEAKLAAQDMRNQAKEKAKEIIARKERELAALKREEIEKIISEAQSKAQRILEETDRYLERLRNKKKEQFQNLIDDLIRRVTRF